MREFNTPYKVWHKYIISHITCMEMGMPFILRSNHDQSHNLRPSKNTKMMFVTHWAWSHLLVVGVDKGGKVGQIPWWQGSWGQHEAHLRQTGHRWAPCWPHELCYLGIEREQVITTDGILYTYPCIRYLWPLLLTWFNFNPSMDK